MQTKIAGEIIENSQLVSEALEDGKSYVRRNGTWAALDSTEVKTEANMVDDTPTDGKFYVRKNGEWVALDSQELQNAGSIVSDPPNDGKTYVRKNGQWVALDTALGGAGGEDGTLAYVGEAPNDGKAYVRQSKTWKDAAEISVARSGDRGELAGSEISKSLSGNQRITANSNDTIVMSTSGAVTLTFTPAAANISAIKVISLTAYAATTLTISGAVWANNGSAPTWGSTGNSLVLVAHFIGGRVILNVSDNTQS